MRWSDEDEIVHIEDDLSIGAFEMNAEELNQTDRTILLQAFRQFRSHDDETDDDYSNRDELEQKLIGGGELTDLDQHMLLVGLTNEAEDQDTFDHFHNLLG